MKNLLILFCLCCFPYFASAQNGNDNRAHFVGLNNGEKVYARRVQLKSPLLKSNYFLLDDSIRFSVSAVKYYQNDNGFFLKIADPYGRDDFAERVVSGRISKYFISRTSYNNYYGPGYGGYGGYGGWGYGGLGWGGGPSRRNIYFFTKDDGDLQSYNYNNLREALADNPGSLEVLDQYRKSRYIENGVSLVGAGLLIYGLTQSFNMTGTNNNSGLSPTVYAGAAVISIPLITGLFKKDKLTQAIELYNYDKK